MIDEPAVIMCLLFINNPSVQKHHQAETHCICYGRQQTDSVPFSTLPSSDLQLAAV